MAKRKMSLNELAEKVGITLANLSVLKNNKARAVRFSTLDAICKALDCEVGDIIEYRKEEDFLWKKRNIPKFRKTLKMRQLRMWTPLNPNRRNTRRP